MTAPPRQTDHLFLSARIHAREAQMLTPARAAQALAARTDEEARRILAACGYPELLAASDVDDALARTRRRRFSELAAQLPDTAALDVFRIPFDYHNAKAVLKAALTGRDAAPMLLDAGRIPADALARGIRQHTGALPDPLRRAVDAARTALGSDGAQACDILLDQACFAEQRDAAARAGSAYFPAFVRAQIDRANLRAAVRGARRAMDGAQLHPALIPGGTVPPRAVLSAFERGDYAAFSRSLLKNAVPAAAAAARGGDPDVFERACDAAIAPLLRAARRVPFGPEVVLAYLALCEQESAVVRLLLSGRAAGLSIDTIEERLGDLHG